MLNVFKHAGFRSGKLGNRRMAEDNGKVSDMNNGLCRGNTVSAVKRKRQNQESMQKKNTNPMANIVAMILCGGKGTRLREVSELLPKPMVPIGEQPILWHIMKSYAAFGVKRFILCLGYKREVFIDYFMNYHLRSSDATVKLGHNPEITFHGESEEADWEVTLAGTGLETMTGGRVQKASKYLKDTDEDFFLTYGDGVADIDLNALYRTHKKSGKEITISAVHPEARFGETLIDGDSVVDFAEKPPQGEGYINGGYMVVNKRFLKHYLPVFDPDCVLEQ